MPPPITHTIGQSTYNSNVPPTDVPADCEALLCACARREIPDLAILREWHRQMPGWVGILGHGNPDAVGKWAFDQFSETCFRKDRPRLHLLIAAGLHQVGCLENGDSALRVVVFQFWPQAVVDLVEFGGDIGINRRNFGGVWTALDYYVVEGPVWVIPILLRHGADPKSRDGHGYTSLHRAAVVGNDDVETVELLVRHGADPLARNDGGDTPLDCVRPSGNQRIMSSAD